LNTAVILAQGPGTKIWPFGSTRPKAAIPIGGAPLLQMQIANLQAAGIRSVIVVAQAQFAAQLRQIASQKGSHPSGASACFLLKGDRARRCTFWLSTRHRAQRLRYNHALQQVKDDHVLVLYGDVLLDPQSLPRLFGRSQREYRKRPGVGGPLERLENPTQHLAVR